MKRTPCSTCPWRRSTPKHGFPGGHLRGGELCAMVDGRSLQVMQCHATPDDRPAVCVGFLRRHPDTLGVRLACVLGAVDPSTTDLEHPPLQDLHTLPSVLLAHGSVK